MKNPKTRLWLLVLAAVFSLTFVTAAGVGLGLSFAGADYTAEESPEGEYYAIINIKGTIQSGNESYARVGYDHFATLEYIDSLMEDENNKGILLDVDSGGGTVYESDEMYLKLMEYKEVTGRPVHAYFNSTACSGAYYISCSADYISQNRNGWTGSIGVIISTVNYKGLYDKLGIEEILIVSGNNKGMGSAGSEMNDEHIAIYQSLVDESYEQFVGIVAQSRGFSIEKAKEIADGRIYSALQAVENGLIDKVESWEAACDYMEEVCGAPGFYKQLYYPSEWETLFGSINTLVPKSDMEAAVSLAENGLHGVPLYMYVK